jgi:enterochelin esterase-like enzyme
MTDFTQEEISFSSQILNASLNIKIAYPVQQTALTCIYLLDANYFFDDSPGLLDEFLKRGPGMLHTVQTLMAQQAIPPSMLIGIGYTEEQRNPFTRDNADLFYNFFKQEFIPYIESHYPVSKIGSDRVIFGYSSSAHFSMYTLMDDVYRHQMNFGKFISIAGVYYPWLLAYQSEEKISQDRASFSFDGRKLYMAIGSEDEKDQLRKHFHPFVAKLQERHYEDFQWTNEIYDGYSHYYIPEDAFRNGLIWLFSDRRPNQ